MQQPKNDNENPSHSHTMIQEYANYLNSIPCSISNMGAETSQMILIITPKCYSYRCLPVCLSGLHACLLQFQGPFRAVSSPLCLLRPDG